MEEEKKYKVRVPTKEGHQEGRVLHMSLTSVMQKHRYNLDPGTISSQKKNNRQVTGKKDLYFITNVTPGRYGRFVNVSVGEN